MLDLVVEDERKFKLTASGLTYAENVDPENPWIVDETQAGVLRDRLSGSAELADDARIALQIVRDITAGWSNDDLGRALRSIRIPTSGNRTEPSNRKVPATENFSLRAGLSIETVN